MSVSPRNRITTSRLVVTGLVVCLALAGIVSLWASGNPDGLEFVAERLGFIDSASEHGASASPFADYGTAGVDDPRLSGGLAGIVGVVVVAVVAFGLMHLLRRRGPRDGD
ncbi:MULTISPECIES: PDGLE domain-containing protein [unclassified Knoellia]|uniref:PDGLE domain-containing protein n=1 Tax=Knoellia altitudinis TaxID=3404795 RepID=UPI00360D13D7